MESINIGNYVKIVGTTITKLNNEFGRIYDYDEDNDRFIVILLKEYKSYKLKQENLVLANLDNTSQFNKLIKYFLTYYNKIYKLHDTVYIYPDNEEGSVIGYEKPFNIVVQIATRDPVVYSPLDIIKSFNINDNIYVDQSPGRLAKITKIANNKIFFIFVDDVTSK